ncbi:mitochondrial fission 1 protein-like [Dermacentor silvarum]|uniref:mitochondrial fission 1 protein-like n=1 Tax=Dermacentor silvarum TaxID=543639 RepID=UPI00189747D5|nr:mitochondrial fission 1 protein-like [Dermacentor silvarum]
MSRPTPPDCERLLHAYVDSGELHRIELSYNEHLHHGHMLPSVQYDYGRCLVFSRFPADIIKGIVLMEQLIQLEYRPVDCCYMTALAHTKLGNYSTAMQFTKTMLVKDPRNCQGVELQELIHRKVVREYLFQVAVVGGVVIMIGVLISMVMARR